MLRTALKFALGEEWIERDKREVIKLPQKPSAKERWLTPVECARLLKTSEQTPHLHLFVMVALHTGARKGAIAELTWQQVDFGLRVIDFNPYERAQTKKGRAVVPITKTLFSALLQAAEVRRTDFVIEWNGGPAGNIRKAFARACQRAGLVGVTPHVLRHTAATQMVMSGVPITEISRFLGHTSTAVTEGVYAHHTPDWLRSAAEKLDQALDTSLIQSPKISLLDTANRRKP